MRYRSVRRLGLLLALADIGVAAPHVVCAQPAAAGARATGAPAALQVTLLGTGNPRPSLDRFGPALLIEAGGRRILIDSGRGVAQRLFQLGAAELLRSPDLVLLTHLHSDHVVGLPDLWLTGWEFGRTRAWSVLGPPGTTEMCRHLEQAFAWDIRTRIADEGSTAAGAALDARDVAPGIVYDVDGLKITALAVDHGERVTPAYGYRIDFGGRSVVVSGDTRYFEPLLAHARSVDVFIHEAVSPEVEARRSQVPDPKAVQRIIEHHATIEQVGRLFALATPRLGVISHIVPSPATAEDLLAPLRSQYKGSVAIGYDLMTIVVGEQVDVFPRRTMSDR